MHGTEGVATVWLALDDADEANATMQLLPCSHRPYAERAAAPADPASTLGRAVAVSAAQAAAAVPLVLGKGGLSVHDAHLVHGSGANRR